MADLFELIDYILPRSELVILTNGNHLSDVSAQRLKAMGEGRLRLQVSLEGPNPRVHDSLRGRGSFKKALGGILNLLAAGLIPIVQSTGFWAWW